MAENELVFGVRQTGAQQAAAEILLIPLAAEEAARRVAAVSARAVTQASARAQAAVAAGGSVQGDVRGTIAAARLQLQQDRLAVSAQNVASAQVRADAATLRASASYQKATESAGRLTAGQQTLNQALGRTGGALRNVGLGLTSFGASLSVGLTAPLVGLAALASSSAKDIDSIRNRLVALEGSVEGANQRLLRNQELARRSVGVTNELANHSFALFKALNKEGASLTDQTIERIIAGVGRLNAAFSIDDLEKFQRNLVQIFTLNFNTRDIREALRQVPIFSQLLEQAFGTSSPDKLRKLKAQGKLTLDAFVSGLAGAVETDPRLSQIGESIGTRLTKTVERIKVSLAPLGDAILSVVERGFGALEPAVRGFVAVFNLIPRPLQTVVVLFGALTAATGPFLFVAGQLTTGIGGLVSGLARLNAAGLIPTAENFAALTLRMQGAAAVATAQVAAQEAVNASTLRFTAVQATATVSNSVLTATVSEASLAQTAFARATDATTGALARQAVAQRAAQISTTGAIAGWLAVGGAVAAVVAVLAVAGVALYQYYGAERQAVAVTAEQAKATNSQVAALKSQIEFVGNLRTGVTLNVREQERLKGAYAALNPEAQARIGAIRNETKFTSDLRAELERLLVLKGRERDNQAAELAADLAGNLETAAANEKRIEVLNQQIEAYTALAQVARGNEASLTAEQRALAALAAEGTETGISLAELETTIAALGAQAGGLRKDTETLNTTMREQSDTLALLAARANLTERDYLLLAKAQGRFKGSVEETLAAINRFRAGQAETADATGIATDAIEEETESLKDLRRALREAEIAARSRADAARRAFEEGSISSSRATEVEIENARQRRADQLRELDEFLAGKRKEREALKAVPDADEKAVRTAEEAIKDAESRKRIIVKESENEVENLRSAQRVRERDETERHNEAQLSIFRTNAERRIDILRDAAERDESLRLENEREIVKIERSVTDAEVAELTRRRDLAAEGTEARLRLQDELDQKLAERRRRNAEQQRRLDEAELENSLRLIRRRAEQDAAAEVAAQGLIDRIRDAAERGRTARAQVRVAGVERDPQTGKLKEVQRLAAVEIKTYADSERAIADIIDRGFQSRIDRLNEEIAAREKHKESVAEQTGDLKRLEQERANAAEDAGRRIREAEEERDPRARFERGQRELSLTRSLASAQLAVREAALSAVRSAFGRELELINRRYDLENERITLAGNEAQGELDRRQKDEEDFWRRNVKTDAEFQRKKLEIQQEFDALRKAEAEKTNSEIQALEDERQRALERQNPNSTRSLFGDTFADAADAIRASAAEAGVAVSDLSVTLGAFGAAAGEHFAAASAQAGTFTSILLDGIDQINAGLGDMLQNWVLIGDFGSQALRKLLASTLAYYAKTFLIKALDNIGEGFSNLAKASAAAAAGDYRAAVLYSHAASQNFISAAKYGIAAAATAIAGRAVAGDSFKQKETARRAVGGDEDRQPNNRNFTYGGSYVEPSSVDAAGGSTGSRKGFGGMIDRLVARAEESERQQLEAQRRQQLFNAQVAQTLSRVSTARPGDVVTMGAAERPDAIGAAVVSHSQSSGDFNEYLQGVSSGRG